MSGLFLGAQLSSGGDPQTLPHRPGQAMENSLGKCFVLLGRSEFPTACPVLMAWKSLWITPYAVLGALRPPEEKKARLRLTATPRYPG